MALGRRLPCLLHCTLTLLQLQNNFDLKYSQVRKLYCYVLCKYYL
jgi:hypothetical protein